MKAIVDIAGAQVQVSKGDTVRVPKLSLEAGAELTLTEVLMLSSEGQHTVGKPHVAGAAVKATVQGHGRDKKVIVFKIKRRKNYRRRNGHRQDFTELQIDDIVTATAS